MNYHTPSSFSDASTIAAKSAGQIRFLAGGTDVLVQMRSDILTPDDLIDVKQIQGVKNITKIIMAVGLWELLLLAQKCQSTLNLRKRGQV